jgi:pSer/pThr/pTyr-binding forkhead associated (FHA) protein
MQGIVRIAQGPDAGRCYPLGRNQKLTVGRGVENAICLNDAQVSRSHCEIAYSGNRVVVSDVGSGSVTFVNGAQLQGEHSLEPGDIIAVGQTQLTFQWSDADQKPTETYRARG